jgi:multicomponent Na+:H+ antiporter subunit F
MLGAVMIVVLVSMGMVLLRAFMGSSACDRILAVNSFGTHVVIFTVLLGYFKGTAFFIDVAIVYGLISFVTTIAFLMYFKYKPEE